MPRSIEVKARLISRPTLRAGSVASRSEAVRVERVTGEPELSKGRDTLCDGNICQGN
jgi:hypothetical protein